MPKFSLRFLFLIFSIFVLVTAVVVGKFSENNFVFQIVASANGTLYFVDELREHEDEVLWDYKKTADYSVRKNSFRDSLENFAFSRSFSSIAAVSLDASLVKEKDLATVVKLSSLRHLMLNNIDYLSWTKHLGPSVEQIELHGLHVRRKVRSFSESTSVKCLSFSFSEITDNVAQWTKRLPNIEVLLFQRCRFYTFPLKPKQRNSIKRLVVSGCTLAHTDCSFLGDCRNLEELILTEDKDITDSQVEQIQLMPKLRNLDLSRTSVSDATLAILEKLANLKSLYVDHTQISQSSLIAFSLKRPDISIVSDFSIKKQGNRTP